MADLEEVFEYRFTPLDPIRGDHIDPPFVAVYETLLVKGADGRPRSGLAESWQVDDDGLTWRLRLRENARFHSGESCDAAAVAEALELCRWGEGLERQVWYWDPVDSVSAPDHRTVLLRLHHPCPRLPVLLWGTHTGIVNPRTWHRLGAEFGAAQADGTGPYRLVSYSPDEVVAESVRPVRGPTTIRWRSVPALADRAGILAEEGADAVRSVDRLPNDLYPRWRLDAQPEVGQFYLALNFNDPRGFDNPEFRRCVDAFIDRDEIVRTALDGHGDGRRSPIPVGDEFAAAFEPHRVPPLSRASAWSRLQTLGWAPGPDGILARDEHTLHIDCVAQDTDVSRRIAQVLTDQLRPAGIELRMSFADLFAPFYRAVEAGPAAFLSKWLWPDAMEAVYGFSRADCIKPAGGNWQSAVCPQVDAAFDRFLKALTPDELAAASAETQSAFMTDLPYIPLVSTVETLAVGPRAGSLTLLPRTLYPLYQ